MLKIEKENLVPSKSETELVTIPVSLDHPLLQLKRELPWEDITEIMVKHWRKAGKNVDGGPGPMAFVFIQIKTDFLKTSR